MIIGYHLQRLQLTPLFFNRHQHVRQRGTHAHRFDNEFLDVITQQTFAIAGPSLGRLRDERSHSGLYDEPAFLHQVLHHLVRSVRVDFQFQCERSPARIALVAAKQTWSKMD
jgi:hypothetical protein